jgi:hypothetical protein
MTWHLAIYETARLYGGPEEGGWYYETGRPIRTVFQYTSRRLAQKFAGKLNAEFEERNQAPVGRNHYCGLFAKVTNHPPVKYPDKKPHWDGWDEE